MITPIDSQGLSALESEWRALETSASSLCQGFDYARLAFEAAEARGEQSFVLTERDGGRLRGVWGLTLRKGRLHSVLRPFSCGANNEYGWPLLEAPDLADRMFGQVSGLARVADRLIVHNLPSGSAMDRAAAALPFSQKTQFNVAFTIPSAQFATWEDVEKRLSRSHRQELRRRARRLAESGEVAIGWTRASDETDRALSFLFERKAEWLKEKEKSSAWLGRPEVPEFFRRFARTSDRPLVAAVRVDGVPIAAALCLVSPRALEYYMTTFDPAYGAYSPSTLLIGFLAKWAIERRLDFDMMIFAAPYKERWPVERRPHVTRTFNLSMRGLIPHPVEVSDWAKTGLRALRQRYAPAPEAALRSK
jgi:CelD/BcsL family acetyltransferase involved in cellulose biosynthesis